MHSMDTSMKEKKKPKSCSFSLSNGLYSLTRMHSKYAGAKIVFAAPNESNKESCSISVVENDIGTKTRREEKTLKEKCKNKLQMSNEFYSKGTRCQSNK